MKYIVAVSGGVDSVALLNMLVHRNEHQLVVAHVDHGIRADSAADARFVEALAREYKLPFVDIRLELGVDASENAARTARYQFLREKARELNAQIVTAHHVDDLVETVAINLTRGTGWRGLAVFGAEDIVRPLVHCTKAELYDYAVRHRLEWVEDETNRSQVFLRNRLRGKVFSEIYAALTTLWRDQGLLRHQIDREVSRFNTQRSRYFFIMLPETVALELLRTIIEQNSGARPPRPHAVRALLAIKVARPGTTHQLGGGVRLRVTRIEFVIETL